MRNVPSDICTSSFFFACFLMIVYMITHIHLHLRFALRRDKVYPRLCRSHLDSSFLYHAPSTCAVCEKPASDKCARCRASAYCSKECQAADWKTHKTACADLQLATILERTADIVHKAYLNFRETTWDTVNFKVEIRDDEVVVYDEFKPHPSPLFIPFPNHLMKDEGVKEAVLTFDTCNEPLVYMEELFQQLLHGCAIKIQEVGIKLKPVPRKTTAVFIDGTVRTNWPDNIHEVLRVTSTKSGKTWYIDISGGQYGITRTFWTAKEFYATYVKTIVSVLPFGSNKKKVSDGGQCPGLAGLVLRKTMEASTLISEAIATWTKANKISLSALVRLPSGTFESEKEALLTALHQPVRDFVLDSDFTKQKDAAAIEHLEHNSGRPLTEKQKKLYIGLLQTAGKGAKLRLPAF
ncbi:MYND-type zinc finger protein samB [Parastagonospora nodorum]|nr:MYND-type zinc finger protein samB [Parastagonospora nodorum]KAH4711601.1 MYND-type zinc finger protein samB [Parastagonospora nodorum]KAH4718370.1 MYND-type zinc finger protein samB [Parastagonospora nodorum]KAH4785924.1 MYND-type zinc finger protein samB [Parastagonospora nodorum]KAH4824312.1 MYND-type zinc finger protein samB [Parastagonospora nodorum]